MILRIGDKYEIAAGVRCGGYEPCPCPEAVACCGGAGLGMEIVTSHALIQCIACLCTGGSYNCGFVFMAESRIAVLGVGIAAILTGMDYFLRLSTGCRNVTIL
jgi:hypothetical protein